MKRAAAIFLFVLILMSSVTVAGAADYSSYDFRTTANGIVKWKKNAEGTGNCLFTDKFTQNIANSSGGEWYACYMGRLGFEDNPQGFLDSITTYVVKKYNESGTLSDTYATDYHKIALAVISAGGNPYNVGGVNLIADGVYNRKRTASLGKQGINGWTWGLITLDSLNTKIPDGSSYNREEIIIEILKYQIKDGGFSVVPMATKSDIDITAMTLCALAPYQYDNKSYTYVPKYGRKNRTVTKTVGQIIDESLAFLSDAQQQDGGYESFGTVNSESVSQVIITLCSLGIDPQSDKRFVKNRSLLDSLMSYKQSDGGFAHKPGGGSDAMASEQALGAVAALERFYGGGARLFDFTDGIRMTTFVPKTDNEQPTIPVPSNPHKTSSSNSSSSSSVNSAQNHGGSTTAALSSSSNSANSSQSASSIGGTTGGSVKANEKESAKATKSNDASGNSSSNSILEQKNSSESTSSQEMITQSSDNDGPAINSTAFVLLGIILIAAFVGYYLYRKKKGLIKQKPEDDFFNMLKKDREEFEKQSDEELNSDSEDSENENASGNEMLDSSANDDNGLTTEE
ncbi:MULTISPECIES: prenyltransferase/squalene oxidase repeat-containing protein [unclassified Ruminococcus]|uniref:prenyltransferase/squalene oxidase repeat-containing protein n=1 Tax=unclassified Ruminococcus TaxID=2608920 RepID=UPI00210ECDE2|nr:MULTISPECIES: prenyltransferase/squalene oxidase repeat-containing protein [unclassified Ruminococcus]MCQ4022062.1 LPXTG cell wall anchor domain-containing protein [Ruminococcus sp. zg-924]MCQ4114382.1 LPXTG cell wall anchor domain-containing protein [Ruminococcus sp. zg-921]